MWASMTGFGRGEAHGEDVSVTAEVRSVNHRFLDIHVRCPSKFLSWEMPLRGLVRETVKRGKVDLFVAVREWGRTGTTVRVNRELLSSFVAEASRIREDSGLGLDLSVRDLLGVPDLFVFGAEGADPAETHRPLAENAVRAALAMLSESRREEGERLRAIIREGVGGLSRLTAEIASLSRENKELAVARFRERIGALAGEPGVEPARRQQEAAFLVDRLDVTEECDRLASHIAGLTALLEKPGEAVGKRFDFLVQEVFRELNTASNKSAHAGLSGLAVGAKTELEKIREQIQNVE